MTLNDNRTINVDIYSGIFMVTMHIFMHMMILWIILILNNRIFRIYLGSISNDEWEQNYLKWDGDYNNKLISTWEIDDISKILVDSYKIPIMPLISGSNNKNHDILFIPFNSTTSQQIVTGYGNQILNGDKPGYFV